MKEKVLAAAKRLEEHLGFENLEKSGFSVGTGLKADGWLIIIYSDLKMKHPEKWEGFKVEVREIPRPL